MGDTGPVSRGTGVFRTSTSIDAAKQLQKKSWGDHVIAALSGKSSMGKSKALTHVEYMSNLNLFTGGFSNFSVVDRGRMKLSTNKQKATALKLAKALSKMDIEKFPESERPKYQKLIDSAKTYYKLHDSDGYYKSHPLSSDSKPSLVQKLRNRFFKPSAPKPQAADGPIVASASEKTTVPTSSWEQEISSLTTKTPNAEEKLMLLYNGHLKSKMTSLKEKASPREKRMIISFEGQIELKGGLIENKIHSLKQLAEMDKEISARNSPNLLDSLRSILANRALSTPEQAKLILANDGLKSALEEVCNKETKSEVFEFIRDVHSLDANNPSATSQIKTIYDTYLKEALSASVGNFSSMTIPTEMSKTININMTDANRAHLETINSPTASTAEKMSALNAVLADYLTGQDNVWGDVTIKLQTHLGKGI